MTGTEERKNEPYKSVRMEKSKLTDNEKCETVEE
jgi:hypothetical protein